MIINIYKSKIIQQPTMTLEEVTKMISQESGLGLRTIQSTIAEYKQWKTVRPRNKTKIRSTFKVKMNDVERNAIRRKIYDFWLKKQIPTLDKLLNAVKIDPLHQIFSRSTMHQLLEDMNFFFF